MPIDDQLFVLKNKVRDHISKTDLDQQANSLISTTIVSLLNEHRFYGEVFVQLTRQSDYSLTAPIGLTLQDNKIILLYNPLQIANQIDSANELLGNLEHVALHLVFRHPLRYPRPDALVNLATDLTVNQYLDYPNKDLNITAFNHRFMLNLPMGKGSQTYLNLLKAAVAKRPKLKQRLANQDEFDSHRNWKQFKIVGSLEAQGRVDQLVNHAWQNTDNRSRGMMNTKLVQKITRFSPLYDIKWQRYLRRGVSDVIKDSQETTSRFNRQQPYRMDLRGEIPNYLQQVNVFVDNSGSMSDQTISYLLAEIEGLLRRYHPLITILGFDNQVHQQAKYHLNRPNKMRFKRFSGGGTSFQSIFDWLKNDHQDSLNVILTDGYGEKRLNYHHQTRHLLWVLTQPQREFSVQNPHGLIISLPKRA